MPEHLYVRSCNYLYELKALSKFNELKHVLMSLLALTVLGLQKQR